jgi:hypothetical protein
MPVRSPTCTAQIFHENFFCQKKLHRVSKIFPDPFPDTRPQSQNDFKIFRSEKILAQYFKKNFPTGSQGKPGYPIIASHTQ